MNLLPTPKIKSCLFCGTFNLIMVNGVNYENNFQSLKDWTLKKKFNCRKCNVEMGFFVNNSKQERLVWLEFFGCEEIHLPRLKKLYEKKKKYKTNSKDNDFLKTIKEIENVQNLIRIEQTKIKIKTKIQNKGLII